MYIYIYRYVPESLRWLQTENRVGEVAKILSKVAESNGKTIPDCVKDALVVSTKDNGNVTDTVIIIDIIL